MKKDYIIKLLIDKKIKIDKQLLKNNDCIIKANNELDDKTSILTESRYNFLKDYIEKTFLKNNELIKELKLIELILKDYD